MVRTIHAGVDDMKVELLDQLDKVRRQPHDRPLRVFDCDKSVTLVTDLCYLGCKLVQAVGGIDFELVDPL